MNVRHALVHTTLGPVTIVANGNAIARLYFRHRVRPSEQGCVGPEANLANDELLAMAATQLHEYLVGDRRTFDLPCAVNGDEFQRAVWDAVAEIPFGETESCVAIAERLGKKGCAYRIGRAVEANPLSIVIPDHRVLGTNGKRMGCDGGFEQQALLAFEDRSGEMAGACSDDARGGLVFTACSGMIHETAV